MEIQKGNVVFTDEDRRYLVVKKYSDDELEEKRQRFNQKRKRRRVIMAGIILALILLSYAVVGLKYACYVALIFMIFVFALYEDIDRTNIKAVLRSYYYEIQIDKVLPREAHVDATLNFDVTSFFPVEGRDTTSGYKSIFYIDQDQYLDAEPGKKVKISVRGEQL